MSVLLSLIPEELIYFFYGLGLCLLLTLASIVIDFLTMMIKSLLENASEDLSDLRDNKIQKIIK